MSALRIAFGLLLAAPLLSAQSDSSIVISNVTLIDVESGQRQPGVSVVISGNRIAQIGRLRRSDFAQGARIVDGSGKFLIPGLWDFHVHSAYPGLFNMMSPLYTANGITGVREMFGTIAAIRSWREAIANGSLAGPRIVGAGHILDGPKPIWRSPLSAE